MVKIITAGVSKVTIIPSLSCLSQTAQLSEIK